MLLTACKGGESVEVWVQGLSELLEYFLLIPVISIEVGVSGGKGSEAGQISVWRADVDLKGFLKSLYYVLSAR